MATTDALLAFSTDTRAQDKNGMTPLDLATDDTCCALLVYHASIIAKLNDNPRRIISTAVSFCATLSKPDNLPSSSVLPLNAYRLKPSFLWTPPAARAVL